MDAEELKARIVMQDASYHIESVKSSLLTVTTKFDPCKPEPASSLARLIVVFVYVSLMCKINKL